MEPAPDTRRQLGQIMVDEGFLTEAQLLDALAEQNRTGTPLGKVLVDLGFVSPGAVANALAEQHGGLLRTEYGTSAGLREMAGRAPIRAQVTPSPLLPTPPAPTPQPAATEHAPLGAGLRLAQPADAASAPPEAPAPEPVPVEPAAVQPQPELEPAAVETVPEPPAPEPEPEPEPALPPAAENSERVAELESKLHAVLTERNALAQSFNELQARLSEAAQAHEAGVSAEVEQRVGALESQLQATVVQRDELERAQQQAAERVAELEGRLAETADSRQALEAELHELRSRPQPDVSAELQELAQRRDEAEVRAQALEADFIQLREQADAAGTRADALQAELNELRSQPRQDVGGELQELAQRRDEAEARAQALEAELASLREHSAGQDNALVSQVAGLNDTVRALTEERDSAVARATELEPQLESLRKGLSEAVTPTGDSAADVAELRRQLAARERRLTESVGEIAKLSREHRAVLQLVERQFQLEETTTSVPEPKHESAHVLFVPAAGGYTLVEREGVAPEAGDVVELDGGRYVVRRHGPSPLPGPRRRCAYLERA